jgi:hypothetical protein
MRPFIDSLQGRTVCRRWKGAETASLGFDIRNDPHGESRGLEPFFFSLPSLPLSHFFIVHRPSPSSGSGSLVKSE